MLGRFALAASCAAAGRVVRHTAERMRQASVVSVRRVISMSSFGSVSSNDGWLMPARECQYLTKGLKAFGAFCIGQRLSQARKGGHLTQRHPGKQW